MARKAFPYAGAWVIVTNWKGADRLGILARVGRESVEPQQIADPKNPGQTITVNQTVYDKAEPFGEVHLVDTEPGDTHGEHATTLKNVPFDGFRQATYAEIQPLMDVRKSPLTPLAAHRLGYELSPEETAQIPELEAAERAEIERATRLAEHPEMMAFDEQARGQVQALVDRLNAERAALADKVVAQPQGNATAGAG
jgi:hypothetical protein